MSYPLEIYQYDSGTIGFIITGEDLSTFTPVLTVKRNPSDSVPTIQILGMVTDISTGSGVFPYTYQDSSLAAGTYVYDVVTRNGETIHHTNLRDTFTVKDSVY